MLSGASPDKEGVAKLLDEISSSQGLDWKIDNQVLFFETVVGSPAKVMETEPQIVVTPAKMEPDCKKILTSAQVEFELGSPKLTSLGKESIAEAFECLDSINYLITGHTDNVGSDINNLRLSYERAKSVKNYLVILGVDASRLSIEGLGESQPVADNETALGRAQNRRIEFTQK